MSNVYAPAAALPSPQPAPIAQSASTTAATDHTVGTIVGVVFGVIGFILVLCLFSCCCGMCRVRGTTVPDSDIEKAGDDSTVSSCDQGNGGCGGGVNDWGCPGGRGLPQVRKVEEVDRIRETILSGGPEPGRPPLRRPPARLNSGGWRDRGGYGPGYRPEYRPGYGPTIGGPSPRPPGIPPGATLPNGDNGGVHYRRSLSTSSSGGSSRGTSPTIPLPPRSPSPPVTPPAGRRVRIHTPPPRSPRTPPRPPPPVRIIHPGLPGRDCVSQATLARVLDEVADRQAEGLNEARERVAVERGQRIRDAQRYEQRNDQLTEDVTEMREMVEGLGDQAAGIQQDVARLELQQQFQNRAAQIAAARLQPPPVVVNNNLCSHQPQSGGPIHPDPDLPDGWPEPTRPRPGGPGPGGIGPGPSDGYTYPSYHTAPEYHDAGEHWQPPGSTGPPHFDGGRPGRPPPPPPPPPPSSGYVNVGYGATLAPELSEVTADIDSDRSTFDTASEQPSPRTRIRRPSIEFHGTGGGPSANPGPARPMRGLKNRTGAPLRPPEGFAEDPIGGPIPLGGQAPRLGGFPGKRSREDLRGRNRWSMHPFPPSEADMRPIPPAFGPNMRRRHSMDRDMRMHMYPMNLHPGEPDGRRQRRRSMDIPDPGLHLDGRQLRGARHPFIDGQHVHFATPESQSYPHPLPRDPRRNSFSGGVPGHSHESDISSFDAPGRLNGGQFYDPERVRGMSRRTSSTTPVHSDGGRSRHLRDMRRVRRAPMETIQSQGSYSEGGSSRTMGPDHDRGSGESGVGRDGRMQYDRY
ncbi:hypothetical protein Dda_1165 [Drechslerella dactyloides]|uniref:Uncharacterized protein n=1 Tax=Drechslerella dactyloides TaxID=74499 RepID=A0AAD6J671_DREDA|nr:hypothetical protein Dda_1165 [Drechslerella dactyloides]